MVQLGQQANDRCVAPDAALLAAAGHASRRWMVLGDAETYPRALAGQLARMDRHARLTALEAETQPDEEWHGPYPC